MNGGNQQPRPPVPRHKIPLKPGKTLVNWMQDKQKIPRLPISQFTREQVEMHDSVNDFWCILHGKVYDLTAYIDYHPGGAEILLPYAGKDISNAFDDHHAWVNYETLLDTCFLGFLIF